MLHKKINKIPYYISKFKNKQCENYNINTITFLTYPPNHLGIYMINYFKENIFTILEIKRWLSYTNS